MHIVLTAPARNGIDVIWVPVTIAWRVLGLRMKTVSRYGG